MPLLFAVVFVLALAAAFENPARAALLPLVVSRARFVNAVPIHSTVQALAFMTGPALAGVVIGACGVAGCVRRRGDALGGRRRGPRPACGHARPRASGAA